MLPLIALHAQSDDEIISGSGDIGYGSGVKIGQTENSDSKSLSSSDKFCHFFLEGILAYERHGSLGLGGTFTYLPDIVGGYMTGAAYMSNSLFSGGVAVRPLARVTNFDWQLFGGPAFIASPTRYFDRRLGIEIGTRFCPDANNNYGSFAWWSLSFSRVFIGEERYFTIGLSISLRALTVLWIL